MKKFIAFLSLCVATGSAMAQLQAPVLSSPANMATVVDVNTQLVWAPSLGGLVFGYEVEVAQDSNFTSPITNFPINGTAAYTSELQFGTGYYWRVRAIGSGSTFSPWSAFRSFTTFLDEFTNLEPSGADKNPELTLVWDAINGVTTYHYEVDDDMNFGSPMTGSTTHPNSSAIISQLKFNTTYYYRIWASHGADISDKSTIESFTTRNMINMIAPVDVAVDQHPKTELKCNNTPGVTSYRFQINDSPVFDTTSLEFVQATVLDIDYDDDVPISWFTSRLKYGQVYYWRIQGLNNTGKSSWSSIRSFFTTDEVTLSSPGDGETMVPKSTTLIWDPVSGTEQYKVEVDTDVNFSDPKVYYTNGDSSNHVDVSFNDWSMAYNWRVRSIHSKDSSDWSDIWSFSIHPTGVSELKNDLSFKVSPNPVNDVLHFELSSQETGDVVMNFYNTLGEVISSRVLDNTTSSLTEDIDVSSFKPGVYLLMVQVNNSRTTQRVVIR